MFREEHEDRLAEHESFRDEAPLAAIGALGAVVAQTQVVSRLDVEDVRPGWVGVNQGTLVSFFRGPHLKPPATSTIAAPEVRVRHALVRHW